MDEGNSGVSAIDSAGECDSIPELRESTVMVGGERVEVTSVEDETVAVGGGMVGDRENHVAPEFVTETAADVVKVPAVLPEDGVGEVMVSEPVEEGANRVDYEEREAVVAVGLSASVSDESVANKEGDELVIDSELEIKKEDEIVAVLDVKLESDVTHSESQLDAGRVEIAEDAHIEVKGEEEFRPEESNTVSGSEHQLSELQTDAAGDELNLVMERAEALKDEYEMELGHEEDVAASGGVENESVERMAVDDSAETTTRGDDVAEERGDMLVNDSEFGGAGKPTEVEKEKGDTEAMAEIPAAEVETDGSVHLTNVSEQEQVHESNKGMEDVGSQERDEHVENKTVVDDENFSIKFSSDAKLDEHLKDSKCKEHLLVQPELPAGDIKIEEDSRGESEMTRNVEVDHLPEDADMDTEKGTNSIDSKTPDDDGKMETEDTMSDVDEAAQEIYDSPSGLQDEEDETIAAEEGTGTQDTEMETETDVAESGKSSGGKQKRAKLTKSSSITRSTAKGSSRKTVGEDVCFICFDGGELVLCDRR